MARRLLRSRRAISPILATLLLIVIAVAAIVVTYAWIMTYMSSTTEPLGIMLKKDAVSWPSSTTIVIWVRNTGTEDATIDAVYIGTSSNNLTSHADVTYDPSRAVMKEGGTIKITINNYAWSSSTYYFRIVPKVGEALVFQETP